MSDVPPTRTELDCLICGFSARSYGGLQWHYDATHPNDPRRRHQGRPSASGQERRRRKLVARRVAKALINHAAGSGGVADGTPARPAAPPPNTTGSAPPGPASTGPAFTGPGDGGPAGGDHVSPLPPAAPSDTAPDLAPLQGHLGPDAIEKAVQVELDGLLELARVPNAPSPSVPPRGGKSRKRRRGTGGAANVPEEPNFSYVTLQTKVRAMFEELGDWQRSAPLAVMRKRARDGKFNTVHLRALQRFILTVGRGGLSLADQEKLFDFLDVWDGTQPGQVEDQGHVQKLRETFPRVGAFKAALRDDVDAAVRLKGWRKCRLREGGQNYDAFFTPALHPILDVVRSDKNIRLWSGATGPAPPTVLRESALDGDAFRMAEKAVIDEHGSGTCVLGIHMFSDSFQLSWSGGKCFLSFFTGCLRCSLA